MDGYNRRRIEDLQDAIRRVRARITWRKESNREDWRSIVHFRRELRQLKRQTHAA